MQKLEREIEKLRQEKNQAIHDLENYKIEQKDFLEKSEAQRVSDKKIKSVVYKNLKLLDVFTKEMRISEQQQIQLNETLCEVQTELRNLKQDYQRILKEKEYFENETIKLNNTKAIKVTRKYWEVMNRKGK